jgi:hypothetical protein
MGRFIVGRISGSSNGRALVVVMEGLVVGDAVGALVVAVEGLIVGDVVGTPVVAMEELIVGDVVGILVLLGPW